MKTVETVLSELRTSAEGLSTVAVVERRRTGPSNALVLRRRRSSWRIMVAQLKSPLVLILLASATISFGVHGITDGWIILAIVAFNALVGFAQERRADDAMAKLHALSPQRVRVFRDNEERELNVDELVVGDVVVLETGSVVPADGRLIEAANLKINEAVFTGEAVPNEKNAGQLPAATPAADWRNIVWRSTTVVAGRGRFVVTEVGPNTRFGLIVRELADIEPTPTPFQRATASFAQRLSLVIVVLSLSVFLLGAVQGVSIEQSILLGVSLIVSMIPEGLPVVITLTFAWGMWKMAKRRALIRKLDAVETLGAVTVIASDKTGTLTFGEMMVETVVTDHRTVHVTGEGYRRTGDVFERRRRISLVDDVVLRKLVEIGVLNNDSRLSHDERGRERWIGDPTEISLAVLGAKVGFRRDDLELAYPRVGEFPFDFSLKYMVTMHRVQGEPAGAKFLIAVKGAPRQILALCGQKLTPSGVQPLTEQDREEVRQAYEQLAQQTLRGLCMAYVETSDDWRTITHETLGERLIYLGLVGIRDPLRLEARDTIQACRRAGIRVMMLTGDYRVTAMSVAHELGIIGKNDGERRVLDGTQLEDLSDEQLAERLTTVTVFSRVSPEQKLRIARLLKKNGEVVAMTGDGINDVPALTAANIGVAVGLTSTDAAKEAADMVITDGNLSSIVAAVEEGRSIFRNIQRVLIFLLASNLGSLVVILTALFLGFPLPLLPIHIMWLNIITDPFLGVALAREPKSPTIMHELPRPPRAPILSPWHWVRIAIDGGSIAVGTFTVFLVALFWNLHSTGQIFAMTLTTNAIGEWLSAFTSRSSRRSTFAKLHENPLMLLSLGAVLVMHFSILYIPFFARVFRLTPFGPAAWLLVVAGGSLVVVVEEIRKAVVRSRLRRRAV